MQQWVAAHGTPQQVAMRCLIVLASGQGKSDLAISKELSILAIYLTPPTPTSSVFGCGRGLSQDVA